MKTLRLKKTLRTVVPNSTPVLHFGAAKGASEATKEAGGRGVVEEEIDLIDSIGFRWLGLSFGPTRFFS